MLTETRQSRSHVFFCEERRPQRRDQRQRRRRRHHTLDNATLDQFKFICIPLHRDESRRGSSSSHNNLTMSKQTTYSTMPETSISNRSSTLIATTPISSAGRRVRFNFDDHLLHQTLPHRTQLAIDCNSNRHSRSTGDIRQSVHRVQVNIPIHRAINPWLNVDSSTKASSPAKTRYLTSKRIDINRSHQNLSRLQGIAPFIDAELHSNSSSMVMNQPIEPNQNQWYRQMYRQLHKPPEDPSEIHKNSYQPTYTFPEDFNGDSDQMEDYIRKTANRKPQGQFSHSSTSSSLSRTSNITRDDRTNGRRTNGVIQKVLRFDEPYSSTSVLSPPFDRFKSTDQAETNHYYSSAQNNHFSPTSDTEQHTSRYRHVLKTEENPSNVPQSFSNNKQDKSKSTSNDTQVNRICLNMMIDFRNKRRGTTFDN